MARTGSPRLPVFKAAVVLVVLYAIFDIAWLQLRWGGEDAVTVFSDLSAALCACVATVACALTWRVEAPARRRAWGFFALAGASWAVGEIIWSTYELVLNQEVPFPSIADIGFLAAYPLAALGTLTLPTSPPHLRSRVRTVLDALVIAGSMLLIAWATFFGPLYRANEGTVFEQLIGLAYPIFDIVLIAVIVFVVARAQRGRRTTLVLIALGIIALVIADSGFAYLTLIGAYETGGPIDAAWDVAYLLIALAAIRHDPTVPRPERRDDSMLGVALPYGAVVLAVGLTGYHKLRDGGTDGFMFWGTVAIVIFVVVRQLITLLDNISLNRNLEAKIRERTAELQRSEERHRSLVQNSSDVVTIVDEGGIIAYQSAASERVFGYRPGEVTGRRLVDIVHPEDRNAVDAYLKRFGGRQGSSPVVEWRMKHSDGTWRWCESIGRNAYDDPNVSGFVFNTRDISERKELELQLRHEAFHDQLTGAANRALFRNRAEHALQRAARTRRPVAVLYCDLDNLKEVNDVYGHAVGDQVLANVADRLTQCIRAEDTVARLGGDEFAVLLTDSGGEGAVRHVATRLLAALAEPHHIDGHVVTSSGSVGVALSWGRQEVDDLLRNADLAMYGAKNRGKARYELFESTVHGSRDTS